jgi:glycosyltransferase involved in cell wall biosynthesis
VPVVVSDRGGPAEIVEHGVTGLVTKARSADDLCAAIERLLDDPDLRRRMSAECRTYAETCRWERIYLNFWQGESAAAQAALPVSV